MYTNLNKLDQCRLNIIINNQTIKWPVSFITKEIKLKNINNLGSPKKTWDLEYDLPRKKRPSIKQFKKNVMHIEL